MDESGTVEDELDRMNDVLALIMVAVTVIGVMIAVWIGGADSLKKM